MKSSNKIIVLLISLLLIIYLSACNSSVSSDTNNLKETKPLQQTTKSEQTKTSQEITTSEEENTEMTNIEIAVGEKTYTVKMYDNPSAKELINRLPLTIEMNELNGNEKYYYFENSFSTNTEAVQNIKAGELMLYGSECLVLFYKGFPTSYSYTRLGYIGDTSGLEESLGKGNITVTLKKQVE